MVLFMIILIIISCLLTLLFAYSLAKAGSMSSRLEEKLHNDNLNKEKENNENE